MESEKGDRKEKGLGSVVEGFFIKIARPLVMNGKEKSITSNRSSVIDKSATTKSVSLSTKAWTRSL